MGNEAKYKILVLILVIVAFSMSCDTKEESIQTQFPTITKYTIPLYGIRAEQKAGKMQTLAGQLVIKGKGKITWQTDIPSEGDYEVTIGYSVNYSGGQAMVSSNSTQVTDSLPITSGVYSETGQWYMNNFERRKLNGMLNLSKGINSISLSIDPPSYDSTVVLFTLELNRLMDKKNILEEVGRARQSRLDTDWFAKAGYGAMFHWTSRCIPQEGEPKSYHQAVDDFDVKAFVDMVEQIGASYIIFTANHADPHFPAPLTNWEKTHPGWTTKRDLIMELADGLNERDIKLFLYFATHVYAKFEEVDEKEFTEINHRLIAEVGSRYKNKVAGYWFDGWYQCYERHRNFDFEKFYQNCKTGNPERHVTLNSWLYPIVSEWQDYWAGEIYSLGVPPSASIIKKGPARGLQYHALLALERGWVLTDKNKDLITPQFEIDALINFIKSCRNKGPVTLNLKIYQDGSIPEESWAVMQKVKQAIRGD